MLFRSTHSYNVLKIDNHSFRLSDAGVKEATSDLNYIRREYVDLNTVGIGTQTFTYPDIVVKADITYSGITSQTNLENYQYTCCYWKYN